MAGPQYQVIAEVPVDDFAVLERVQRGLSRSFSLDLSAERGRLRRGGVCVCRVDSLALAKIQAELVRGIGADYRILDPQGRLVGQGEGRRGGAEAGRIDGTLHGGFAAPVTPPVTLPVTPRPGVARSRAETIGATPPGDEGSVGGTGDETVEVSAASYNLDALEVEDLVMLDGSRGEQERAPTTDPDQYGAMSVFAPPVDDEAIELDDSPVPRPIAAPRPHALSATLPAVKGTGPAAAPAPAPAAEEPPPLAELMPASTPPAEPTSSAATIVGHEVAPAPREPRTSGRTPMARRGHVQRVLFGGWFQHRPRARIVVGFLLALGLGSVAPAIHSRSVVSARIRPELQELVSARAYPALARLANYRTPEEIEESISGIKSRAGVLAFVMWLLISGTLVFLWFRFV